MQIDRHIWLCGFMGCGKSTVGAALARMLGASLTDMDAYIEEREQMTIPQIFAKRGEEYFRSVEACAIRELGQISPAVIATGGGAMLPAENAAAAKASGLIVFLDIPFDTCYARIAASDRPIVRANSKEALEAIFDSRHAAYQVHADICFDRILPPLETARELKNILATF